METIELFQRLTVALAIGLLIGLERGWQAREDTEGERAAGFRTHAVAALLGGVWGAISNQTGVGGAVALGLAFVVFAAAISLFRYREAVHDETFGATSAVAAMLAFALGALTVVGDMQAAAAAGVAVTGLLALKTPLHGWIRRVTWPELRSGLVLLAMTVILLPLLPQRTIDPWQAINPFEIWLLTVMIAAISFLGYIAVKAGGETSGVAITGIAGGFASSTAVTLTMARLAREHREQKTLFAAGALFAGATMFVRVLAIVAVINLDMLSALAAPFAAAAAVLALSALVWMRRAMVESPGGDRFEPRNPLDLGVVARFGLLLTAISVLARLATRAAGGAGAVALAALSGLADVDAITLSMARLDRAALTFDEAAAAIGVALVVNTIAKAALTWWVGGTGIGWRVSFASAMAIAAATATALATPRF
jgi:uncharacterized membrane protein (DUF4010 family)